MKTKVLRDTKPLLKEKFGAGKTEEILSYAEKKLDELCRQNPDENRATRALTAGNIYPAIGLYTGMQQAGIPQREALAFLDWSYSKRAEKDAASMRCLLKIPGLYKLYPAAFKQVARSQFGEAAGFKATYYKTEKGRVKFDMTQCLYCDVCRREGCPEIVPCFCHTDDVNNGSLHANLCWHRTETMGEGGHVCDFDLYIQK